MSKMPPKFAGIVSVPDLDPEWYEYVVLTYYEYV